MKKKQGFHFVYRRDTTPRDAYSIDFPDRKYEFPLCGTSNYEGPLEVGDVVGVQLRENNRRHVSFQPTGRAVLEACQSQVPQKKGSYTHQEEHLFKITKVLGPARFSVSPVFLDTNKVIHKEVREDFTSREEIPVACICPALLIQNIFDEPRDRSDIDYPEHEALEQKYEILGMYLFQRWINLFEKRERDQKRREAREKELEEDQGKGEGEGKVAGEGGEEGKGKEAAKPKEGERGDGEAEGEGEEESESETESEEETPEKFLQELTRTNPLKEIEKPFILPLRDDEDHEVLKRFFGIIEQHRAEIVGIFGEDWFVSIGTYEKIVGEFNALVETVKGILPERVKTAVWYDFWRTACLAPPEIDAESISRLKKIEIFRVYKADPDYALSATKTVTNWGGIILPEKIRTELRPGNLVRVSLRVKEDSEEKNWGNVIYFTLLLQLTPYRHLATIRNMYMSEYEDIILVIDSRAVTEIPVGWEMNENLAEYREIRRGKGFGITGASGFHAGDGKMEFNYDDVGFHDPSK
jgi:hypothetical protein